MCKQITARAARFIINSEETAWLLPSRAGSVVGDGLPLSLREVLCRKTESFHSHHDSGNMK